MANADKKYANLTSREATSFDWSTVMEDSIETARWSGDNTECIVHWVGKTPKSISALRKPVKSFGLEKTELRSSKSKYKTEGTNTGKWLRPKSKK